MSCSEQRVAYATAERFYADRRYEEALELYLRLANETPPDGQVLALIATMYYHGRGVPSDRDNALHWAERAAEAGYVPAFLLLFKYYSYAGEWKDARNNLEIAAMRGYSPALYYLGRMYRRGWGGPQDRAQGWTYLRRAWAAGHVFALRELAGGYLRGEFGWHRMPVGAFLLVKAIVVGARLHMTDPHSERLQT